MKASMRARFLVSTTAILMLGVVVTSSPAWAGGGSRLEARMENESATLASCKAKWRDRRGRARLSVECEDTGAVSAVFHGCGISVGLPFANDADFDLNLDTRDGDTVPTCKSGGVGAVDLTDANNNVTHVRGTFAAD